MGVTLRTKVYARRGEEDRVFSSVKEAAAKEQLKAIEE